MKYYESYGFKEFVLALGYKANLIKKELKKYKFQIDFVDTGLNTMTGGRLKRLKVFINNERFMLTYGDGLSNVNLHKLLKFHIKSKN